MHDKVIELTDAEVDAVAGGMKIDLPNLGMAVEADKSGWSVQGWIEVSPNHFAWGTLASGH